MIYSDRVRKACAILCDAHGGDLDKGGYPYIFHPFYLATQMEDEVSVCAALLHDVAEDHGDRYSLERLAAEGFGGEVMDAVRLLTHEPGVPYMDYVRKLAANPVARRVKLADLRHNLDTTRTGGRPAPKEALYREALAFLEAYDERSR